MFNMSIAILLATTATAYAQGEVDMTSGEGMPASAAPVSVPGVTSSGAPFAKGTLGLSLPVTLLSNITSAVSLTAERVPTVNVLYFLSDKAAVELIGGINVHKTRQYNQATPPMPEDVTIFGFAVGAGYRIYTHRNKVATFIEPQLLMSWDNTSDSATLSFEALGAFGVEAMLTDWCSLSGAIGGGVSLGNKAKDIQLATTANLAANLYWK